MEQINSVEILGNVGNVKYQILSGKAMAVIKVATSKAYTNKDGGAVIETTWHSVVAFEGKDIRNLDKITKGSKVHLKGRLRNQKFVGSDGQEHYSNDILANKLVVIDTDEPLSTEL